MNKKVRLVLLRLLLGVSFIVVGAVGSLLVLHNFGSLWQGQAAPTVPSEVALAHQELGQLKQAISDVAAAGHDSERAALEEEFSDRLLELERQLSSMASAAGYLDTLMEVNSRLTTHGLALASLLITGVGAGFTVFVIALGFIGFARFEEVKEELDRRRVELDELKTEIGDRVASELKKLDAFAQQIKIQQKDTEATRLFVQQVSEQFFSEALLELLAELERGGALGAEADTTLRKKVREVQDRLQLHNREMTVVEAAIRDLSAIGTPSAIPDLMRLLREERIDDRLARLIGKALRSIDLRREETVDIPRLGASDSSEEDTDDY